MQKLLTLIIGITLHTLTYASSLETVSLKAPEELYKTIYPCTGAEITLIVQPAIKREVKRTVTDFVAGGRINTHPDKPSTLCNTAFVPIMIESNKGPTRTIEPRAMLLCKHKPDVSPPALIIWTFDKQLIPAYPATEYSTTIGSGDTKEEFSFRAHNVVCNGYLKGLDLSKAPPRIKKSFDASLPPKDQKNPIKGTRIIIAEYFGTKEAYDLEGEKTRQLMACVSENFLSIIAKLTKMIKKGHPGEEFKATVTRTF